MNYTEALDWVVNVERFGPEGTIELTYHVLDLLGNPQRALSTV